MPPGVYHSDSASDYQSSMLLLPERFPKLPEGAGDLIAMVPGRNSMWVTGSRNEAGLSALLHVAEKSLDAVHHRCSAALLRLDDGKWTAFSPGSNEALMRKDSTLMKKQDAVNYGDQKAVLEKLYKVRGEDIYVAPFNLAVKDNVSKSWVSWASDADSLLPRAEFINFVEQIVDASGLATGVKSVIEVAWNDAFLLVQEVMEEVPDIYPPRWRVRRFPDAATMAELEGHGRRHEPQGERRAP